MADGVGALQAAEMIGGCPFWKAIGVSGRNVKSIKNTQTVFQIGHRLRQLLIERRRQIPERAPQAMAPR